MKFAEDPECKRKRPREPEKTNTSTIIFVLLIFVLLSLFAYWSLQHIDRKLIIYERGAEVFNGDQVKPPFNPPSRDDLAKTARYIAHYMDWCVISTISVEFNGIPAGYALSVADGPVNDSTGVPYIYITPMGTTSKDLERNASSSFSFTEAQSDYCSSNNFDTEDPRCAKLLLVGKVVKLTADEIPFAKNALFSRHPVMKTWPATHGFYFAKLEISHVHVLDTFGPSHEVPVKDYFAAKV